MSRRSARSCSAARLRHVAGRRTRSGPPVGSISRSSVRPAVVLPQPLSPTRPSVSPCVDRERDAIDRLHVRRPTAARTRPARTGKYFFRSVTSSRLASYGSRSVGHRTGHRTCPTSISSAKWQRTRWPGRDLAQLRLFGLARGVLHEGAARMELAARWESAAGWAPCRGSC